MKSRPAPTPINYKRPLPAGLKSDPQVRKWIYRLKAGDPRRPKWLSEQQLAWVYREVMREREEEFSQIDGDLYLKAMSETCPILRAPDLDRSDLADDMEAMLCQPEMQAFWNSWDGRRGKSGPKPDYFGAKALMATMGMAGVSAHVDDNYAELRNHKELLEVFQRLEGRPAELAGYQHLCKQLPRIANHSLVMAANVEMIKALADLHPGRGIGERLLIDGMGFPAWCKQVGVGKTPRQEAYRRRMCPEAGARAIQRGNKGKRDIEDGDSAKRFMVGGDFWRGYYLVAIADQATGLPLVWIVQDANLDEAAAIVPLLSRLFKLWPEIPAKVIAGDGAWDEKEWCRLCEQDYGIHPIFRWRDDSNEMAIEGFSRKEKVVARTDKGELICADHRNILDFRGAEIPNRNGLKIGKTHQGKGEFRVRATCKDGCGSLSMRMLADWRRLTYYPHYNHGGPAPERFAFREAMLTRLNGIESIWDRLQAGRHVGNQGANRTRVRDLGGHETIVSLALLSMTAATLADQRQQAGIPLHPQGPMAGTNTQGLIAGLNGGALPPASSIPTPAPPVITLGPPVGASSTPASAAGSTQLPAPVQPSTPEQDDAVRDQVAAIYGQLLEEDLALGV